MMSVPSISRVDRRDLLQRLHAGLHEEAHEAELDAVLLLEQVAILGPQRHDMAHVHLVEGGQHRGAVLRLLEAAGDGLTQPRHRHALLARLVVRRRGRACGRRRRRRGQARGKGRHPFNRGQRIRLGDAPVLAGAGDPARLDAGLGERLARRRRGHAGAGAGVARLAQPDGGRARGDRPCGPGLDVGRAGIDRSPVVLAHHRGAVRLDRAEHGADIDRGAVLDRDGGDDARGRGRDLQRHLVGFQFDQRLVGPDEIADLLEPLADGRLGHRFTEGGNANFGRHCSVSGPAVGHSARASSRKAASCARCLLIRPVAVAAEAGRPT